MQWIQEVQKHVDPVDPVPDADPDPQHCLYVFFTIFA